MSVLYPHSWKIVFLGIQLWVDRFSTLDILSRCLLASIVIDVILLLLCRMICLFPWGILIFSLTLVFCNCIITFYLICIVLFVSVALSCQLQKNSQHYFFQYWLSYILFFHGVPTKGTLNFLSISPTFLNLFNIFYNSVFMCCILVKFFRSIF